MTVVTSAGTTIPTWPEFVDPTPGDQRIIWFALDDLITAGYSIAGVAFSVSDAALAEILETQGPIGKTDSSGTAFTTVYGAMIQGKGTAGTVLVTALVTIDDADFTEHEIVSRSVKVRLRET